MWQAFSKRAELPAHHKSSEPFRLHRSRSTYERDVQACKDALYEGESYELCLTTALSRDGPLPDPLHLYYTLRRHSPAPYAAFLSFGESGPQVTLSSSLANSMRLFMAVSRVCSPNFPDMCLLFEGDEDNW